MSKARGFFFQPGEWPYRSCTVLALFVLLSIIMTYPLTRNLWHAVPADHQKKIECRVISSGKVAIAVERIEIWSDTVDKSTEGG